MSQDSAWIKKRIRHYIVTGLPIDQAVILAQSEFEKKDWGENNE